MDLWSERLHNAATGSLKRMLQVLVFIVIAFGIGGVIELVSRSIDRRQKERAERRYFRTHYREEDSTELWL